VSGKANSVAVTLKFIAERDKRLDITTASNNLNDNVQANTPVDPLSVGGSEAADGPVGLELF
jgi:hypothetical protein